MPRGSTGCTVAHLVPLSRSSEQPSREARAGQTTLARLEQLPMVWYLTFAPRCEASDLLLIVSTLHVGLGVNLYSKHTVKA